MTNDEKIEQDGGPEQQDQVQMLHIGNVYMHPEIGKTLVVFNPQMIESGALIPHIAAMKVIEDLAEQVREFSLQTIALAQQQQTEAEKGKKIQRYHTGDMQRILRARP